MFGNQTRSNIVWEPNMLTMYWEAKRPNEQNVLVFGQMFGVLQILSNTIKQGVQTGKSSSPNNVCSGMIFCLDRASC